MIVVAIMAITMTMSAPMVYKLWRKAPMIKAVRDVGEVLSRARAQAVLQGVTTEVVFHAQTGQIEVGGPVNAGQRRANDEDFGSVEVTPPKPTPVAVSGKSTTLDESVAIEKLMVNGQDYMSADVARVRFYPNGTCDDLALVLRSTRNERYQISLEITTGLHTVGPPDDR